MWKGSGTRPTAKIRPWSHFTVKNLPAGVTVSEGNPDSDYALLKYWEYDLIDYLAHSLTKANDEVCQLQNALFRNRGEITTPLNISADVTTQDRNTDSVDSDLQKDLLKHDKSVPMKAAASTSSQEGRVSLPTPDDDESNEQTSDTPL